MTTAALQLPELATNQAQPDVIVNDALEMLDAAVAGQIDIAVAANANINIGTTGVPAQWQYAVISVSDYSPTVLTANRDVVWPNVTRRGPFTFVNHTARILTVKRVGQTGVTVASGATAQLRDNGTDIENFLPTPSGLGSNAVANQSTVTGSTVTDALNTLKAAIPTSTPTAIPIAASDEATALTTGTAKVTFRLPYALSLTSVRASLTVAQTSGTLLQIDVKAAGTSVFTTKPTLDNTEKTTTTAATASVLTATPLALADDTEITIDISAIGDSTAKGLKVYLIGTR